MRTSRRRTGLHLAAATALLLSMVLAADASMPVIDASNLAKNAQLVTQGGQMLKNLTTLLGVAQSTYDTLGEAKSYTKLGDLGGILRLGNDVGNIQSLSGLKGITGPLTSAGAFAGRVRNQGMPNNIGQARSLLRSAFRNLKGMHALQREQIRNNAMTYYYNSVDDASSTAMLNVTSAAQGAQRLQDLLEQAQQAKSLTERVGVLTSVMAMQVDETQQLRALLGSYVQALMAKDYSNRPFMDPKYGQGSNTYQNAGSSTTQSGETTSQAVFQ